ncbi:hypothetical protein [Halococcus salifodinae]|uniref:Uncharacterized protein n=1 Tax=Halococcus salifodinae DSM 8989 TaxID=1227456 RepID=M0MR10_9EURY|nr:hypothetical protein [Halococcus salifodinae]EMA47793.1 hypothetical protein C450_20781 [Halococcus salifodinae DSM 8989]
MSDDTPTITQQYAFSVGEDGETDGIEAAEESIETSLEAFGANVDHRERDSQIDQPEATTFGVDDRPEATSADAGEQGSLFADTEDDQQTLTGERAASQCLFETDESDDDAPETHAGSDDRADEPTANTAADDEAPRALADGGRVEDDHEDDALTPAMLAGTPVGGPGGSAACDSCNRRLTDGHREHDLDDKDPDTVVVYATRVRDTDKWSLRWVSCEDCGPPGDGEADEPGEVVATATLTFDARIDGFALADPELPNHGH